MPVTLDHEFPTPGPSERLAAGAYALKIKTTFYGTGYMVLNGRGDVVFGGRGGGYSATLQEVEDFLTAQGL